MKKTVLAIAVLSIGFQACNKNKDDNALIGKWNNTMEKEIKWEDGIKVLDTSYATPIEDKFTLEFTDDSVYTITPMFKFGGPYTIINGNKIAVEFDGEKDTSEYYFSGKNLVIKTEEEYTEDNILYKGLYETTFVKQ